MKEKFNNLKKWRKAAGMFSVSLGAPTDRYCIALLVVKAINQFGYNAVLV